MKIHKRTNDIKINFLHGGTIQGNPLYLRLDLVGTGISIWLVNITESVIIQHSLLKPIQHPVEFETGISSGKGSDDYVRFGVGLDGILVVLVTKLDHFVAYESHVENIDFIRRQIVKIHLWIFNQFHLGHIGSLHEFS